MGAVVFVYHFDLLESLLSENYSIEAPSVGISNILCVNQWSSAREPNIPFTRIGIYMPLHPHIEYNVVATYMPMRALVECITSNILEDKVGDGPDDTSDGVSVGISEELKALAI